MSMKRMLAAALALVFCFALAAQAQSSSTGYVPSYKIGDKWLVEASYRDMKSPGEPWMTPIIWTFEVKNIKSVQRQNAYVIHVYPKNRGLKMQAILYLATTDLRPLKVIDIFPVVRGVKHQEREFDPSNPEPLLSENTLVPYDLPVFPLSKASVQRADGFGAYAAAPENKKEFAKVKTVGGLRFKKSVTQQKKAPDRQHADSLAAYRLPGEAFQVELFDARAGQNLVQVWQEGSPWALTSESPSRKARLLPPSGPVQLPPMPNNGGER